MRPVVEFLALVIGAYLVGSIPIGVLFARARRVDLRSVGSGNIGATNVARALGKKTGAIVLVLDAAKGALPLLLVSLLALDQRLDPFLVPAVGFAAMAGHCFPPWLLFRGGKGVATALGIYLVVDPVSTLIAVGAFLAIWLPTRVVALGSMAAAVLMPVLLWLRGGSDAVVTLGIAAGLLVLCQHRTNIGRLWRGEEHHL
jgi:glycerol-3-phosphate acyltransferase PlsY